MQGFVDQDDQTFLTFDLGSGPLNFLIDTGFNGALLVGEDVFDPTNAVPAGAMTAQLASSQCFQYRTYLAKLEWFGRHLITRILIGPGKDCLLGTALLNPHRLEIDYGLRTVQLICGSHW